MSRYTQIKFNMHKMRKSNEQDMSSLLVCDVLRIVKIIQDFQNRADGPGLCLTTERTVLSILIGQLR